MAGREPNVRNPKLQEMLRAKIHARNAYYVRLMYTKASCKAVRALEERLPVLAAARKEAEESEESEE